MTLTVAIVGRPNVGKSTLFNRLVGRRLALVDDQPGVTRDLREGDAKLGNLRFRVVDTAGLETITGDSLPARMRRLTEKAIGMADICIFLVDARAGITPVEQELAGLMRRSADKVILAANKCEGSAAEAGVIEAFSLGFGDVIALSAEHGIGMDDLRIALEPHFEGDVVEDAVAPVDRPIQIAVVGRPNAGKSTLVNALLGEDRLLTGPEAGITRDAISMNLEWKGTPVKIFDTAGIRRKARVQQKLEKLSVADGLRAVRFAEVVIVLLDEANPFDSQDLRIADLAEREGRAVVIAVNKWDRVENKQARLKEIKEEFARLLPQLRGAPMITVSAMSGAGLDRLHDAVMSLYEIWNRRIPTAKLNEWLAHQIARHPPPAPGGRRIRIRYMTQIKSRPPSFLAFCSRPDSLPESYTRFLVNGLREDFDLPGTPLRLSYRKGENPYAGKKRRG